MKAYQSCLMDVLKVGDEEHLIFHVKSETSPNLWYSVSLKSHYCNCSDRVSTCKHILGVQSIMKVFFEGLKENEMIGEPLPQEINMEDMEFMTPTQQDVPREEALLIGEKVFNMACEIKSLCQAAVYDEKGDLELELLAALRMIGADRNSAYMVTTRSVGVSSIGVSHHSD